MKTMELENLNVTELKSEECNQTNGGGWISDYVEAIVHALKCGCGPRPTQMSGALSL